MLSDLLVNVSILMTFIFVWHQLFRKSPLKLHSPLWIKLSDGILAGLLGIILMHYSIATNDITILDLRHVPVAIVAFFGGIVPSLIAAGVISIGRYMIDINFSSHVALFMMFFIGLGAGILSKYLTLGVWKKWTVILLYTQLIFSIALYIVSPIYSNVLYAAFLHVICTVVGGMLAFYFTLYIRKSSELFFKYREFSRIDYLTGLYNVRTFYHYYDECLKNARDNEVPCILVMMDIDHFKKINDTHGHKAGDEILKQLADIFKDNLGNEATISRNGGEEFSIIYCGKKIDQVIDITENLRKKVEHHPFKLNKTDHIQLTISIGIAQYDREMNSDDALYQEADNALYRAKEQGRNHTVVAEKIPVS
ncbi:GGDEF domain-containing protein [Halalkalibacillus sediminis]|uniref:GGDEF domain-containing protein n=1 Tax=Halalkalibacillus sediminis TaxID=2018042 RepID=A0A2I0QS56_9BACI|nr:diguanylate cyclase [Halalkalibacillus sediminis]PKR77139.1 GGDEF domain-containing protein [Halalkalibacillus sediminis]